MATALITGGTAGLGRGFAEALAEHGHDIILVARDVARLEEYSAQLADEYLVETEVLPADLSDPDQRAVIEERLRDPLNPIDVLVNNAGFGVNQPFVGGDLAAEQAMLDVLVTTPMRLCHAAAPGMVDRGRGRILNVSSVAGWMTTGTYSAAKAYVTAFTEGLSLELAGTGVTATAVCPGYVRTEFHQRAHMNVSSVPTMMWLRVDDVVRQALRDAARGHPISVTGTQYRALSLIAQYAPRPLVRRLSRARL